VVENMMRRNWRKDPSLLCYQIGAPFARVVEYFGPPGMRPDGLKEEQRQS